MDVLPAKDENADPQIVVDAGDEQVSLGPLRRSARVFWRPDGRIAVLWDLAYSNHFFVRLVRMQPQPAEIQNADQVIKDMVNRDFPTSGIAHYWPYAEGWLSGKELLVVVCADGPAPHSKSTAPFEAFRRGYLLDTDTVKINSSMDEHEYLQVLGKDPCE